MGQFQRDILRTVLYFDIWQYPLTSREIALFLPYPITSEEPLAAHLHGLERSGHVRSYEGYYYAGKRTEGVVTNRRNGERRARSMWKAARFATHVVKRCPFVRAVFISGELSKNISTRGGDVDFFILTEPGRLWIVRALLTLFKKTVLLNRKKFFCLNSFASIDRMELDEHNIYLATEVATLKPMYDPGYFRSYLEVNGWVADYFPNLRPDDLPLPAVSSRRSLLQIALEAPFALINADALDTRILESMRRVWRRRYPHYDDATRERIFRSTKTESRAYVSNFQDRILSLYEQRLKEYGIAD